MATISFSETSQIIDRGTSLDVIVTHNDTDYSVSIIDVTTNATSTGITYVKTTDSTGNNILRLTGVTDGTYRVTGTTADGTASANKYIGVEVVPTTLTINPEPSLVNVGTPIPIAVSTNAQNGFTVSIESNVIARVIDLTASGFTLEGIGVGTTKVIISATKNYSKTITATYTIVVEAPIIGDGTPTSIQLYNTTTKRTVSIQTSNNNSFTNVNLYLPSRSGTLITQESLEEDTKVIVQPKILTPAGTMTNWREMFVSSDYQTILGNQDPHKQTIWAAYLPVYEEDGSTPSTDAEGNPIMASEPFYTKTVSQGDVNDINTMTSTCLEDIGIGVQAYVKVKYLSDTNESLWSDPVLVTMSYVTPHNIPIDDIKYADSKSKNTYYGAYFGEVSNDKLVDDYNYRGNWLTIKNSYVKSNYTDSSTLPIRMKVGYQVTYNNVLYRCIKQDAPSTSANMAVPGVSTTYWEVDTRTALGTPRRVAEEVGIGFGLPDSNCDGLSSGSTSIGAIKDNTLGYIKYIWKGKLCYTPVKPICSTICWNDLAKREAVAGNRTIRMGEYLYLVRLMKEDEYKELFTRLTDGTYASNPTEYYGLSEQQWIEDFQVGSSRYYMTGTGTKSTKDPKNRSSGSWRFVLEYIPEHSAPYNNLELNFPNMTAADSNFTTVTNGTNGQIVHKLSTGETFIYDKYTDTGYFGTVSYLNFIGGDTLNTVAGFTSGSQLYTTQNWLKFYWHGQILYIPMKVPRYNVSYNNISTHNCHHGQDMGGNGKKTITVNGCTYRLMNFIGSNKNPYTLTGHVYTQNYGALYAPNLELEDGKYSQWNELMYRVCYGYLGYQDKNGVIDAGGGYLWRDGYNEEHGGYQIGDNWVTFTAQQLNTQYAYESGTACWDRSTANNTILRRGDFGVAEWYGNRALSYATSYGGWRGLLALNTNYNTRA